MNAAYSPAVRDRCREPHRAGAWPDDDPAVALGSAGSLDAGAWVRLQLRIGPDGRVADTRFTAFGCSAVVASASYVADALVGAAPAEVRALESAAVADALELPDDKHAMAALATAAARDAAGAWERRVRQ